jgi:hypothetical protein
MHALIEQDPYPQYGHVFAQRLCFAGGHAGKTLDGKYQECEKGI